MKKAMGGGGDMTVESRHLVGLFLGVVVLCGVFFTLGYVMGRSQPNGNVLAADFKEVLPPAPVSGDPTVKLNEPKPAVPAPSEWQFPAAAEPGKPAAKLEPKPAVKDSAAVRPPAVASAPVTRPVAPAPNKAARAKTAAPRIAKGSLVLQVAALTRESDALILADALQQKNFPAFVAVPAGDNLYRVQVGPYADKESADLAQKALQREGFKAIIKR
jgi:cell division septation protein DedD